MKKTYPIVVRNTGEKLLLVEIPDFDRMTQGENLTNAIDMGADLIALLGIELQDRKKELPKASELESLRRKFPDDIVTLVNVDFDAYRRATDSRAVRKNVTIPSWLNSQAEAADINFSSVLQEGLKRELGINSGRN